MEDFLTILTQCIVASLFLFSVVKVLIHFFGCLKNENSLEIKEASTTRKDYLYILLITTSLFLVCYVVGYIGYRTLGYSGDFFSMMKYNWIKSDAHHYLHIAENGYVTFGQERFYLAFFPLFPMVVSVINKIIGNFYISGTLVNMIFTYVSLVFTFKYVSLEFNKKYAYRAVLLLAVFPHAFFMVAPFSEPMFISLSIMCLYFARKKQFFIASFCGLLCALTRNVGALLIVPVLIEYLMFNWQDIKSNNGRYKKIFTMLFLGFIIGMGTLIYLGINYNLYGNPLKFLEFQKEFWSQGFGNFIATIDYSFEYLFKNLNYSYTICLVNIVCMVSFALVLAIKSAKVRPSLGIYAIIYFYIIFAPTWLLSSVRYSMACFPLILMLCNIKKDWLYYILVAVFFVLLLLFTFLFTVNFHVY